MSNRIGCGTAFRTRFSSSFSSAPKIISVRSVGALGSDSVQRIGSIKICCIAIPMSSVFETNMRAGIKDLSVFCGSRRVPERSCKKSFCWSQLRLCNIETLERFMYKIYQNFTSKPKEKGWKGSFLEI